MQIIWKNKDGEIMADHSILNLLHITRHFKGVNIWGTSLHMKGSYSWYGLHHNDEKPWYRGWVYERISTPKEIRDKGTEVAQPFKASRWTIRLGKPIITLTKFGKAQREKYYRNCKILCTITWNGKVDFIEYRVVEKPKLEDPTQELFPYECPAERCCWKGDKTKQEIVDHVTSHAKQYDLLDSEYPDGTWRN